MTDKRARNEEEKIGIIGGISTYAGIELLTLAHNHTDAAIDQDHPSFMHTKRIIKKINCCHISSHFMLKKNGFPKKYLNSQSTAKPAGP